MYTHYYNISSGATQHTYIHSYFFCGVVKGKAGKWVKRTNFEPLRNDALLAAAMITLTNIFLKCAICSIALNALKSSDTSEKSEKKYLHL